MAEDDNDDVLSEDEVPEEVSKGRPIPPSAPADSSLANWLQKGPRLRSKFLIHVSTYHPPISHYNRLDSF